MRRSPRRRTCCPSRPRAFPTRHNGLWRSSEDQTGCTPRGGGGPPGDREEAYARKALDNIAADASRAPKGQRNEVLNRAAFRLGTMVARGWLSVGEVEARLLASAHACGLVADDGL